MKKEQGKYKFFWLKTMLPVRSAYTGHNLPVGFTLVEILVAVAIMVSIVSMVYGSYFATAKSTQICQTRMAQSQQTRRVLMQMVQQIRCAYISGGRQKSDSSEEISLDQKEVDEKSITYFNYEPDARNGEILHLVTTFRLFSQENQNAGLFDVIYKFDKRNGTLYLSQKRFVGTLERLIEKGNWRPVLTNIERLELDFFDGQKWQPKWYFTKRGKLPYAARINITCNDENQRQLSFNTIANLICAVPESRNIFLNKQKTN